MNSEFSMLDQTISSVKDILENSPAVERVDNVRREFEFPGLEHGQRRTLVDFALCLKLTNGIAEEVYFEYKHHAWPSSIKPFLDGLGKSAITNDKPLVLIAPVISDGVKEMLHKHGVGWIDGAGNCFISTPHLIISIEGKEPEKKERSFNSVFEKSATVSGRILRILLDDVSKSWLVAELASKAGCSVGQVSKVKGFLNERGFLEQKSDGFRPVDVGDLMREWAVVYNKRPRKAESFYTLNSLSDFENILGMFGRQACLSGFAGGVRYAPAVRYSKLHFYALPEVRSQLLAEGEMKAVESGSNIILLDNDDPNIGFLSRMVEGNCVASPVQVYLDCAALKGRGEEEAEAVLKREILR